MGYIAAAGTELGPFSIGSSMSISFGEKHMGCGWFSHLLVLIHIRLLSMLKLARHRCFMDGGPLRMTAWSSVRWRAKFATGRLYRQAMPIVVSDLVAYRR